MCYLSPLLTNQYPFVDEASKILPPLFLVNFEHPNLRWLYYCDVSNDEI